MTALEPESLSAQPFNIPQVLDNGRFSLASHPFIVACWLVLLYDGRLKTVTHRDTVAIILTETNHIRCVLTVDGVENERDPFWIPRRAEDRKMLNIERRNRSRSHITLSTPCWHGEERPLGARIITLKTKYPSLPYMIRLCGRYEYIWDAMAAAMSQAHAPHLHPVSDRRSYGIFEKGEDDDYEGSSAHRDNHGIVDPTHPYAPTSPSRRTTHGFIPRVQVVNVIGNHGWDTQTTYALFDVFCKGKSPKEAADERGLHVTTLYKYADIIRKSKGRDSDKNN